MFHHWFDSSSSKKPSTQRSSIQLSIEQLEERRVPSFTPGATESFLSDAADMVIGDFNDDGIDDFVAISGNTVRRVNGDGLGGFNSGGSAELIVAGELKSIASSDFNKDGHLDLVVTSAEEEQFFLLTNNGDGTFSESGSFSVIGKPNDIAVGDFDKDGNLDVAVSHDEDFKDSLGSGVEIFLGNGGGSFTKQGSFANGNSRGNIAVTDFDRDGDLDLFVTDPDNGQVAILLGDGTGNFTPGSVFATAPGAFDVATGDFNHDGRTDLAVTNRDFERRVFEDDFENDSVGQPLGFPWEQQVGSFLVQTNGNNFADSNTTSVNLATLNGTIVADVSQEAHFDLSNSVPGEHIGLVSRSSGNVRYMYWGIIVKTGATSYRADIWLKYSGKWYKLVSNNLPGFSGAGTLRFDTIGSSLQLFVDDVLATATNASWLSQGYIGVMGVGGNSTFDDYSAKESVTVANESLSILTQTPGGGFNDAVNTFIGNNPSNIAVHDFSKDGNEDLVITNEGDNNIAVLLGQGDRTFSFKANIDTGTSPLPIAKGDFDRDGKYDVSVGTAWAGNQIQNFLNDFFNTSTGTFEAQQNIPGNTASVPNDPNAIAIGHFNQDNILDYAITEFSDDEVTVFFGDGGGNFDTQATFNTGNGPVDIIVGDFDNDGHDDLAIALEGDSDIEILFGNGLGNFGSAIQLDVNTGTTGRLAIGDFNNDKNLDIAVAVGADQVIRFLNNGDRTFQGSFGIPLLSSADDLVAGDFNEDGDIDLAVILPGSGDVEVLLGNGDGTFTNFGGSLDVEATPNLIAVGDFNNDEHLDFITANTNDTVTTRLGNGDGTFQPAQNQNSTFSFAGITVGDFNGDEFDDVMGASVNSGGAVVRLLSNGDGTFTSNAVGSAGDSFQKDIVSGDFNLDGDLDILVVDDSDDFVAEWLGNGDGTFKFPARFSTGTDPQEVVTADFNLDGKLDYAVANATSGHVSVFLNDGMGGFDEGTFAVGNMPVAIAAGDVDMDGDIDIVTADRDDNSVTVLTNNGTGLNFSAGSFSTGTAPVDLALGDFDQDGDLDIITLNFGASSGLQNYTLLRNADGMGDFGTLAPINISLGTSDPVKFAVGDFNNDSRLDLASTHGGGNDEVHILLSNGPNSFTNNGTFSVGTDPAGIAVGDFNRDGDLDLALAASGINEVEVYLGGGNGNFSIAFSGSAGMTPKAVAVGDFNMDGSPDIVSANSDNTFNTYLGSGNGNFTIRKYRLDNVFHPNGTDVVVGDFNNDGVQDLVITDDHDNFAYVVNGLKQEQILSSIQFLTQPVDVTNAQIMPAIQVQVLDQFGNPIRQSGLLITIALNMFNDHLAGTRTVVTNSDGIAVFPNLQIGIATADYRFIVSIGEVSALSDPFDVYGSQDAFDRRRR